MSVNIDLNKIENQINIMEHNLDGLLDRVSSIEKKIKDRESVAKNAALAFSERIKKSKMAYSTNEVS